MSPRYCMYCSGEATLEVVVLNRPDVEPLTLCSRHAAEHRRSRAGQYAAYSWQMSTLPREEDA
jgi:hypothetical protein